MAAANGTMSTSGQSALQRKGTFCVFQKQESRRTDSGCEPPVFPTSFLTDSDQRKQFESFMLSYFMLSK